MILQKRLMVCASVIGLMAGTALPASAAPWVRGYVVGQYEYAFRYGGRADFTRGDAPLNLSKLRVETAVEPESDGDLRSFGLWPQFVDPVDVEIDGLLTQCVHTCINRGIDEINMCCGR